jgi:ATP-dependent exoDNAse (exonuclease V) beta subunit
MKIIQLREYTPLERLTTPEGRKYIINDKMILPSVTTILSKTSDHSAIDDWVKNVGVTEAERIKNEAANLGTEIHNNLELFMYDKPLVGSYMSTLLSKVIIKNGFKNISVIRGIEAPLYYSGLWAGTADLIAEFNGTLSILDYKNSRKEKKREWIEDYFLQLVAYAMAYNEMFNENIKTGVIMMVTRDAKYLEFILEGAEFTTYKHKWLDRVEKFYNF